MKCGGAFLRNRASKTPWERLLAAKVMQPGLLANRGWKPLLRPPVTRTGGSFGPQKDSLSSTEPLR